MGETNLLKQPKDGPTGNQDKIADDCRARIEELKRKPVSSESLDKTFEYNPDEPLSLPTEKKNR